MSADETPRIPEPSFEFLVMSLRVQAEMQLGLVHFGEEKDRPEPDTRLARHTIDLLSMIETKTRGNLSLEEQRLIGNSLTELRFRFVQALDAAKDRQPQGVEAQSPAPPTGEPSA